MGHFQECLPKGKVPWGSGKKREFQSLFGNFAAQKKNQLELLRVMNRKKPQLEYDKVHQQADKGRGQRGGFQ